MTDPTYQLLDSGDGRRLERFGDFLLDRPLGYALWRRRLPEREWRRADGIYHRSDRGGGHWEWRREPAEPFPIRYGGLSLEIKPTGFGHVGLFPEQHGSWTWLRTEAARLGPDAELLNLFAYTGGSTLAAAQGGARVCHLDASKGVVDWARRNASANGLGEHPVRWMVDDVLGFLAREIRRGRRYAGVILDPPSYGRGAKGEVWKLEDGLRPLLESVLEVCGGEPRLLLLSCHSAGFTPEVLGRLLGDLVGGSDRVELGEMVVPEEGGRVLPSGCFARWSAP